MTPKLIVGAIAALGLLTLGPISTVVAATNVPLKGSSSGVATIDLGTGMGTVDTTFHLTQLGRGTSHNDVGSFTLTGDTFSFDGTATFISANGDKVFTTNVATGTLTANGSETTTLNTITGGTGRFAHATGTFTATTVGVTGPTIGSIVTSTVNGTLQGHISF
jgi:hypothetical protein